LLLLPVERLPRQSNSSLHPRLGFQMRQELARARWKEALKDLAFRRRNDLQMGEMGLPE
jgi:hypothetical protein